jgi:hypothetical protein
VVVHEPAADRLLAVVVALDERLAGDVVPALHLRRVEHHVVDAPGARVRPPARQTIHDLPVGDRDLDHRIDADPGLAQRFRLGESSREAVEQEAVGAVRLADPLSNEPDNHLVGNQPTRVHRGLRLASERAAGRHGGPQHVAGRDLRNAVALADCLRLRALAAARRSQQDQPHPLLLRRL